MFGDFYRGKRVFVTGHTGFKGSWLCEWLLQLGAEVGGYSNEVPTNPSHFEVLGLDERIPNFFSDIRNIDALSAAFKEFRPDVVFHLAAQPLVRLSVKDPRMTLETNVMGTTNFLEVLRQNPQVMAAVVVTSDKCYENKEWLYGYRETDALGGKDPYSASKACAEIITHSYIRCYFDGATKVASARAGNVIGGGDWAQDRLIPDCARAWANQETTLIRSPRSTRPWQHVLEPLSGYLSLAENLVRNSSKCHGQAFNLGPDSAQNHSVGDVLTEMKTYWPGAEWKFENAADAALECQLLRLNCDKAQTLLNWKTTLTFPETIEMTGRWYEAFYHRADAASLTRKHIESYHQRAEARGVAWAK